MPSNRRRGYIRMDWEPLKLGWPDTASHNILIAVRLSINLLCKYTSPTYWRTFTNRYVFIVVYGNSLIFGLKIVLHGISVFDEDSSKRITPLTRRIYVYLSSFVLINCRFDHCLANSHATVTSS